MSVPVIRGDSLLIILHRVNAQESLGLAFRGDPEPTEEFRPAMPTWRKGDERYPDSDVEVVCADEDLFRPAFMALAPRSGDPFGSRLNPDGSRAFYLAEQNRSRLLSAVGYIAVCSAKDFTRTELGAPVGWPDPISKRLPELRSTSSVTPLFLVEITYRDFEQLLTELPGSTIEFR